MLVLAHASGPSQGSPIPLVLAFSLVAITYGVGLRRLPGSRRSPARAASFYAGLVTLGAALISPLDHLALELVSAHMVQHMLLLIVAPPMLVAGRPVTVLTLGMPPRWRTRLRKVERSKAFAQLVAIVEKPLVGLIALTVILWGWHLPAVYEAALQSPVIHAVEHLSFLASGLLLWNAVLGTATRLHQRYGQALFLLFGNGLQSAALGAILTFAGSELYPLNSIRPEVWGLTSLEDQQVAGAIMWVPGGLVYTLAMAAVLWRWFSTLDRRALTSAAGAKDEAWGRM